MAIDIYYLSTFVFSSGAAIEIGKTNRYDYFLLLLFVIRFNEWKSIHPLLRSEHGQGISYLIRECHLNIRFRIHLPCS